MSTLTFQPPLYNDALEGALLFNNKEWPEHKRFASGVQN